MKPTRALNDMKETAVFPGVSFAFQGRSSPISTCAAVVAAQAGD